MPAQPTELTDVRAAAAGTIEMRASVLREPGRPVAVETVLLEPPRRGEVLVRVAAAGVCHSDVRLADGALGDGRWPIVLGHEGAGVIESIGEDVSGLAPGDHVAFCFVPPCGACGACHSGHPTLCEPAGASAVAGTMLDGTSRLALLDGTTLQHGLLVACFAEYAVLPAGGAVPIPRELPLWQAALLGCGVVTGIGAVNSAGVRIGESVCVIGCGGVGLQVVAGARLAGAATIIAVDREPSKFELARRRGATHAIGRRSRRQRRDRGAHRWRRRPRVRGRRRRGDDPPGLGLAATRRDGGRRRAGPEGRRGVAAGDRVPVGEDDQRQLLRLGQYAPAAPAPGRDAGE